MQCGWGRKSVNDASHWFGDSGHRDNGPAIRRQYTVQGWSLAFTALAFVCQITIFVFIVFNFIYFRFQFLWSAVRKLIVNCLASAACISTQVYWLTLTLVLTLHFILAYLFLFRFFQFTDYFRRACHLSLNEYIYLYLAFLFFLVWISRVVQRRSASRQHLTVPIALPAEHVRSPGLFGRWSYFEELITGSSPWSNTELWQFKQTT